MAFEFLREVLISKREGGKGKVSGIGWGGDGAIAVNFIQFGFWLG